MEEYTSNDEIEVFRGTQAACAEFGLVLDAKGLGYQRVAADAAWVLKVAPALAEVARDELERYRAERLPRREPLARFEPFIGSGWGAAAYAGVLILVAYCAGNASFGVDWFGAGALDSGAAAAGNWWRPLTALTLHVDQEHLLGNLLFGAAIGTLAGRMFGPGIAWLAIVLAGVAGNWVDMLVSPATHRAVGASTAVFAALGLLAGFGWGRKVQTRERRLYRWAPLFGGVCLLALLGAGDGHVDVLGHVLGFAAGILLGWAMGGRDLVLSRRGAWQMASGGATLLAVCAAWAAALLHAVG